jgi:putative zinc finger/helix-turn-helix YgiT family protein
MDCPNGHGVMPLKRIQKKLTFRNVDIAVESQLYVCPVCRLEAGTVDQTAGLQKTLAEAYRKKVGLLTGAEIRNMRKKLHLTQDALAQSLGVGIVSIKRWEGAQIQTKSMDQALRRALTDKNPENDLTGNRELSIPRIKLVLTHFETCLGVRLIEENDRMLFAAKYLWYADMTAYRDLGKSMTGATYAALPYGPQLNNYKDLLALIKKADTKKAEPLTAEEEKIIAKISKTFSTGKKVYNAAHREAIWEKTSTGAIIPYSSAAQLTEI